MSVLSSFSALGGAVNDEHVENGINHRVAQVYADGSYRWEPVTTPGGGADPAAVAANAASIAALELVAADVSNATEAELQAALAAQAAGDANLQAALDAHIAGDASAADLALLETALQAQIDTLNTEQTAQDSDRSTIESRVTALEAALGTREINPDGSDRGTRGELAIVIDGANTRTRAIPSAGDPSDA